MTGRDGKEGSSLVVRKGDWLSIDNWSEGKKEKKRNLRHGFRNPRRRRKRRRRWGWIWYITTIHVQIEPTTTNRRWKKNYQTNSKLSRLSISMSLILSVTWSHLHRWIRFAIVSGEEGSKERVRGKWKGTRRGGGKDSMLQSILR